MDKDAYGHVIWNYFKNLPSFEIVERDDGHLSLSGGAQSYFSSHKDWKKHEKEAIKYAKGRCLDIGCGAGRVLLYLQSKRQSGVGIDTSSLAVKVCRLRGVKDARVMSINEIATFKPGSFNSVVMFGNNFGLFQNFQKAKILLKKLYRITSSGGVIIAESREPYLTDNPVHFAYHRRNKKLGRMPGQMRIRVRFMQYATDWFDYLIVSKSEMKEILKGTGWRVKRFIDAEGYRKNGIYIAIIEKLS